MYLYLQFTYAQFIEFTRKGVQNGFFKNAFGTSLVAQWWRLSFQCRGHSHCTVHCWKLGLKKYLKAATAHLSKH